MRRVLVIGLDGATFQVLKPLASQGVMPSVARIMASGACGPLRSTDPPYTGPGWSTFMTGTNPGKHSHFDIMRRTSDFSGLEPVGYHTLAGTTLWDLADAAGLRTALINMPVSYPPPQLNGIVISGALTPPGTRSFTHPPGLRDELEREFGPYILDVSWAEYDERHREAMVTALEDMMNQHAQVFLWALQRHPWDLAAVVMVTPDRIQHGLWHLLGVDRPVPPAHRALHDRILRLYHRVDETVKALVEAAGPETNVLILSDHGFGPLTARVDLNNLLAQVGMLRYRARRHVVDTVGKWVHARGLRRAHVASVLRVMGLRGGLVRQVAQGNRLQGPGSVTDWSRTKAFCLMTNGIFVNLRGREPQGIVSPGEYEAVRDELVAKLLEVRDPSSGERVIFRVDRREDIYQGPFVEYAPDLLITGFDERYHFHFFPTSHYTKAFNRPGPASGNHTYQGVFMATGPDILPGQVSGARMLDIMPTICALLRLPIPEEVDGQVLTSVLREAPAPARAHPSGARVRAGSLDDREREGLQERLRGLGYL